MGSASIVHQAACGAYVRLYPAATNRSERDEFYVFRNSVRIGPLLGYRSLEEAIAGIERNDKREAG